MSPNGAAPRSFPVPGPEGLRLRQVGPVDLPWLREGIQAFLADLASALPPGSLVAGPDGRHDFGLDASAWVEDPLRAALILDVRGERAGFVLFHRVMRLRPEPGWTIEAFRVEPRWRLRGLGRAVGQLLAARCAGYWELPVLEDNLPGRAFAEGVLAVLRPHERGCVRVEDDGGTFLVHWLVVA